MRGMLIFGAVAASLALVPGLTARAEEPRGATHEKVFAIYCAGCHSMRAENEPLLAPDLSGLTQKYGTPLPTAQLIDFVMGDRRLGSKRICGEHVMRPTPFNDTAERSTVRAALQYVAAAQREE